jgi:hypothetical protein
MIAVADGLTRVSIFDREEAWNGPFEYVPYQGAFLFAGLTLPLMIGYTRKARVALTEGLFLWFVFCTTAYTRDFSYVRWPGTPLFITDVVLLILLVSIYLVRRPRFSKIPLPVTVLLVLFFGAGALSAARGFLGHRDAMVVLRDSALVVYTLFLLVGYHLFRSWLSIKRVAVWFLLGSALGALNGFAWFIAAPQERRFVFYGIYILISLAGTVVAMASRLLRPRTECPKSLCVIGHPTPRCIIGRKVCLQESPTCAFGLDLRNYGCHGHSSGAPFSSHQGWSRFCREINGRASFWRSQFRRGCELAISSLCLEGGLETI